MGPYAVACEKRTGFLGVITDGGHAVRTAVQREDFVRIVLAGLNLDVLLRMLLYSRTEDHDNGHWDQKVCLREGPYLSM
jgi:hypothetical protein